MTELPPFVSHFTDRHGGNRYRFRRAGYAAYIQATPGSDDFERQYAAFLRAAPETPLRSPASAVGRLRTFLKRRGWPLQGDYIYFVATQGMVKIGFSSMILDRVSKLSAQSPSRIRFLAALPGGRNIEKALHEMFADDRVKGEWFKHSPAIREVVKALQSGRTFVNIV